MQEIGLHEGLENINDEAFYKCFALSSIHIPSSVTLIGDNLCFECINLNDFYVDANNPYYCAIDGVLFTKGRKTLKCFPVKREGLYNIPEGTEIINSNAFATSRLESVIIPMSVTKIEDFAFFSMQNLHDITIPSTVTSIGKRALGFCTNLKKVIWEGGRVIIPEGMFSQCLRLDNMELPDNIESIGSYAFGSCYDLAEITIPSKVTSIGDYAFAGSGLRKVRSLMQVPCTITSTVFENINSNAILYVPEESIDAYKATDNWKNFSQILPIGESAVELYAELNSGVLTFYHDAKRKERTGTTYELNDKALEVHDRYSWLNSTNSIMKVVFDSSFGNVRLSTTNSMFSDCNKLTEIQGIENLNTSEVTDMLGMFQHCNSLTNIDLSKFNTSKVTNMAGMFWGCSNLKTIILPDDLTFIDTHQFVDCSSLTDISIPSSVTFIGDHAFQYCYSLKEITIPADVTSIGDNAFSCTGLKKVKSLMQAPCRINSNVFENVSNNATLYVPAGCKAAYEAADYWKDFKKIMGPSSNLIYMVDGEEYRSYEIEHGSAITPEPAPTKEGYTFSGWSEIPEKMPAHDVTVTGTFTINKYKLTYKVDGAEYKSYDVEYGATITPEPAPTKEGYNFSGWSEIPEKMPAHDVTVTGTFTIVDPVTITAKSYSRKYGEENPNFEYTSEGATLTGIPEITCEATVTSPVGEYAIVISKGTVTNYNDHYVNGVLTITKAPLTITAKNYSIKQGESLPKFETEYGGFKNNETDAVLTKKPTITTTATSASEPGIYDIVVSGAETTNYDITYVKGTLTISAVEVEPVTETETTTFSEEVNENTDLSNTIIDNTYYTMNAENGDGYDATEQAIVLNSTTTAEQMNTVQNAQVGDATMQANYNGIIFEVPAGSGTITVEAKTIGSHVLNVQIGNGEPTKITKSERGTVDVPYNVTVPTYVYLYASTSGSSSAPKRAAAANSLLLYSYKVTVTVNGISVVTYDDLENAKWYTTDGLQLQGKPTKKGLYIVNGRKVVVK